MVYSDGTDAPKSRSFTGSGWSAAVDVSEGLPPTAGTVQWIGELRQGIERLRSRDPAHAGQPQRWLQELVASYARGT